MSLPLVISISAPRDVFESTPFTVSGSLRTPEGVPIADALIHVYTYENVERASGTTDSAGNYSIEVSIPQAGSYLLYSGFLGDSMYMSAGSMALDLTVLPITGDGGGGEFPLWLLAIPGIVIVGYALTKKPE